ncbi:MAG: zinc ribbon domain-containing protein [Desulfobacteraceae bacterium]|nr:zinc ribbon domain-containing protein [Desulfobacteraceae bacterium]
MPIYEFECNDCGEIFESLVLQGREDEIIECSKCKSSNIKKLLSPGSFRPNGIPKGKGGFNPPPRSCKPGGCSGCMG